MSQPSTSATQVDRADLRAAKAREQAEEPGAASEAPSRSAPAGLEEGLLQVGAPVNGTRRGGGIIPTISRHLLGLQASNGNQYVRRLVDRSASAHQRHAPIAPGLEEEEDSPGTQLAEGKGGFALPLPPPSGPPTPPAGNGSQSPPGSVQRLTLPPVDARDKFGSESGGGAAGGAPAAAPEAPQPTAETEGAKTDKAEAPPAGERAEAPAGAGATGQGASAPDTAPEGAGPPAAGADNAKPEVGTTAQAGEESAAGGTPAGTAAAPGAPPQAAGEGAKQGAQPGAEAAPAPGADEAGAQPAEKPQEATREIGAADMDEHTAALVADFLTEFGSNLDQVTGPAARLLDPGVRSAAAHLVPDRKKELVGEDANAPPPEPDRAVGILQRTPAGIQRAPGTGTIPTRKVKVTLPNWQKIPLFERKNVGSWFLLSGAIESPTYEGEAKPPDDLRDDTKEQELQLTADGKVKGYSATFYKDTLGKVGNAELEGQVQVETTTESVKVSGLSLKLPDLGGSSNVLLQGQFDFDLLEWEPGKPPDVMILSYTQKVGVKADFTTDGWKMSGSLYLPFKISISPDPVKVAEFVARTIGPRLAAAAPAGLAIAAPLVVGGVCIAVWIHAVEAGQDMAKAMDEAKFNTLGYVTSYFNTIMGYTHQRYNNAGSAQGKTAAQKVLDGLRFNELPAGAQQKIRDEYIKEGTMNLAGVQDTMWKQFRAQAIETYRKKHDWDAWAYDHGLPNDLQSLIKVLDVVGPPWPVSAY